MTMKFPVVGPIARRLLSESRGLTGWVWLFRMAGRAKAQCTEASEKKLFTSLGMCRVRQARELHARYTPSPTNR